MTAVVAAAAAEMIAADEGDPETHLHQRGDEAVREDAIVSRKKLSGG